MVARTVLAVLTFALAAFAAPAEKRTGPISLSNWHGISSLDGFDNFYGSSNFCGIHNSQTVIEEQSVEVVCHSVDITIIQQQLVVLQEFAKKIITQQVCEVETQTIVFSQFESSISEFGEDIRRRSGRNVGFDSDVSSLITHIHDSQGELVSSDLGFQGSDVGSHLIVPRGSNWVDSSSPASVESAFSAAQQASLSSGSSSLFGQ